MKTLEQIKEDVANESKYSSWDALLEDIKGDIDLIDFTVVYYRCIVLKKLLRNV